MKRVNHRAENAKHSYVMVTYEFGEPIYIANKNGEIGITDKQEDAQVWGVYDYISTVKLPYHKTVTGYNLQWEEIKKEETRV